MDHRVDELRQHVHGGEACGGGLAMSRMPEDGDYVGILGARSLSMEKFDVRSILSMSAFGANGDRFQSESRKTGTTHLWTKR